jgi:hypothetical protein
VLILQHRRLPFVVGARPSVTPRIRQKALRQVVGMAASLLQVRLQRLQIVKQSLQPLRAFGLPRTHSGVHLKINYLNSAASLDDTAAWAFSARSVSTVMFVKIEILAK